MENGLEKRREQQAAKFIGQIPKELYEMLDVVDLLPSRVGCKTFEKQDEWMIADIAKFIIEEYKGLSPQEVLTAFTLSAKRQLSFNGKIVDLSTWGQKLSVNMVGLVLTAYKEHLFIISKNPQFVHRPNQKAIEQGGTKLTNKSAYEMLIDMCEKDKVIPKLFALWGRVFEYLKVSDKLEFLSTEEIKDVEAKAKLLADAEAQRNKGIVQRRQYMRHDYKRELESNFQRLIVIKYLEKEGYKQEQDQLLTTKKADENG